MQTFREHEYCRLFCVAKEYKPICVQMVAKLKKCARTMLHYNMQVVILGGIYQKLTSPTIKYFEQVEFFQRL